MENNIENWFWYLLIGGIIGWLAGLIVKGRGFGIVADVVVGVVGGLLGGWIFTTIGITTFSTLGSFITALIGAVILVSLTRFFKLAA